MARYKGDLFIRMAKLDIAVETLRRVAQSITPSLAPQVARKIRSAIRSADGARRNAERAIRAARGDERMNHEDL